MSALGSAARLSPTDAPPRQQRARSADVRTITPVRVQPVARRRGLGAFMGLVVGLLASGLFGLLLLNTTLGEGSFRIKSMQVAVSQLSDQTQQLQQQVSLAEAPMSLRSKASALGMVPSSSPVFLRLSDDKILGVGVPAVAGPWVVAPQVVTKPAVTKPVVTKPVVTKPVVTKPTTVKSVTKAPAKPVAKPPTKTVTKH